MRVSATLFISLFVFFASLAALGLSPANATTYNVVNQGGGILLSGTITTDGVLGTLSQSDITAWHINQNSVSGSGFPTSIDSASSTVSLTDGALSATGAGLVFNFASTTSSKLIFRSNQMFGSTPAFQLTYCDVGAGCSAPFISSVLVQLLVSSVQGSDTLNRANGTSPIATLATPLPAALPLFATGLGALGLLGWRRKRKAAAAVAAI